MIKICKKCGREMNIGSPHDDLWAGQWECVNCDHIIPIYNIGKWDSEHLRERLAALCHEQWSGWMKYLFSKSDILETPYGDITKIPPWATKRWLRQMNTPYDKLSEEEKESDRREADKFIKLILEG